LTTGAGRFVEIDEEEGVFQDGKQAFQKAHMGAENVLEPADNSALPKKS